MPLVTDCQQVKDVYQEAAELGVALPAFCCEDRETLEAILASAKEKGEELGVEDLPVLPTWTVRYPPRGQMKLITACGDPVLGMRLMLSDLELLASEESPYGKLRILPNVDHAFPWLDGDILDGFVDQVAGMMFDASERPFEENIRLTAEYVEKVHGRVVVEGAVDEIYESDSSEIKNEPTTVAEAQNFLARTGVDIVVPNVGTEHRATVDEVQYDSQRAREISTAVGNILCLHGTSSLGPASLAQLPDDGFAKINIYTTLAVHGGQAVARHVLNNFGNILTEAHIEELVAKGVIGEIAGSPDFGDNEPPISPKLAVVSNPPRRDAWFAAVRDRCKEYLDLFRYQRYAQ